MTFEDILVTTEEPIGIITFNRPNVLNALRSRLLNEVSEALAEMERDQRIRAVVVTGAGKSRLPPGRISPSSTRSLRLDRAPLKRAAVRLSRVKSSV